MRLPTIILWITCCAAAFAAPQVQAHYSRSTLHGFTALLPDVSATPGLARPDATKDSVCNGGSTKQFRDTTPKMKANAYLMYGATKKAGECCEVDHLISLELGGADDPKNLWPQPYTPAPGAHEKDLVENYLHHQVCAGSMTLAEAQREIASNWLAVYVAMQGHVTAKDANER